MIETLTIITLSVLFLIFFRPGKTPPLNNPLVIERPGQYHITFVPLLNLAQPFIEAVVGQIGPSDKAKQCSTTQYFEVRDNQVTAHGYSSYLLAITQRNGMLYFQAVSPQSDDTNSYLRTISEFADAKLVRFPATGEHDSALDERIVAAVQEAARSRSIHVKHLAV
jgi:regulator of protease activity HflC (stomatin/prohibitin superfamily)